MTEQTMKVSVGIFVLSALIFLAILAFLFGGYPQYFKQVDLHRVQFDNAAGITPGSPVRRSGVKIGEVRAVELDDATGKVIVTIQIEKGFTIRWGETPTVVRSLLGGDASIDFLPDQAPGEEIDELMFIQQGGPPPKKKGEPIPPGTVLEGKSAPDAAALTQRFEQLIAPTQEAMVEVRRFFRKLDGMTPLMEETIRDYRDVARTVQRLAPVAEETMKDYREVAKSLQKITPLAEETVREYRDVARAVNKVVPEIQQTNAELRELMKLARQAVPELRRTGEEVQAAARTWNKVGERVDVLIQTNEEKLVKAVDRMQEALRRVNDVLSDENQKALRDTLQNVEKGTRNLDRITQEAELAIKDTRGTLKRLDETIVKADDVFGNMQKLTKPFGERGPVIMKNVEDSTAALNRTLADVRELLAAAARSDGTLNRLITDPALYNNLNDSAYMVTKILPRLDRMMRDLEIFADKLARHPESIGLGGVVRPSSGLKESPSVIPWRVMPH